MKKIRTLGLLIFICLANCTSYEYSLNNSKIPVSFSEERMKNESSREFRIQRKLTWVAFDLVNTEEFDLSEVLRHELPNAKKIYNLRIDSEESVSDSLIRLVGTGMQIWAFVSNRPLVSRRTVIIRGEVVE